MSRLGFWGAATKRYCFALRAQKRESWGSRWFIVMNQWIKCRNPEQRLWKKAHDWIMQSIRVLVTHNHRSAEQPESCFNFTLELIWSRERNDRCVSQWWCGVLDSYLRVWTHTHGVRWDKTHWLRDVCVWVIYLTGVFLLRERCRRWVRTEGGDE